MTNTPHKPMRPGTKYQVAVFYPDGWEPYGGIHTCATLEDAMEEKRFLVRLGHKHVHVWSVTVKMIET